MDKLGQKLQTDVSHSGYQRDNELNEIQDELSTLPSPQMSDVELDSDQDTVETDVLVRSYHEKGRGGFHFSANSLSFTLNVIIVLSYIAWSPLQNALFCYCLYKS